MGHSFGESKRAHVESKKNFDEIDAAGFNDFSKRNFDEIDAAGFNGIVKKNFDEIDNAGFKDYLRKRNFDEIDAAGFNDLSKRSKLASAIRNKELSPDVFQPMMIQNGMQRRNFDEIDAAGFNGFSKREKASTKNGRLASIIVPSRNPVHPSTLFPMEDMERYQSGIYSDIYSPIEIDQNDRYYLPTTGRYASWSPFPLYMSGHTYPPVKPKYADVSTFVQPFYPAPQYESIAPFYSGSSPNGPLGSNQGMGRKMNSDSFRPSRQECTAMGDGKAIREESRKLYRTLNGKKPSPDYQ